VATSHPDPISFTVDEWITPAKSRPLQPWHARHGTGKSAQRTEAVDTGLHRKQAEAAAGAARKAGHRHRRVARPLPLDHGAGRLDHPTLELGLGGGFSRFFGGPKDFSSRVDIGVHKAAAMRYRVRFHRVRRSANRAMGGVTEDRSISAFRVCVFW